MLGGIPVTNIVTVTKSLYKKYTQASSIQLNYVQIWVDIHLHETAICLYRSLFCDLKCFNSKCVCMQPPVLTILLSLLIGCQ